MTHRNPSDDELRELLQKSRVIAMVGASAKPDRPSYGIMKALLHAGFRVIPVTPKEESVLGRKAYPSLDAIPEPVDIVGVFRRAEDTPPIADDAVRIGAKALWLQLGISNDETATRATNGGLTVVMDKCIGHTVQRLGISHPREAENDVVEEADRESFPASDPPAWTNTHAGGPDQRPA